VAVLFCDVVGFTAYSENNPPETVFAELEMLIDRFEAIAAKHGLDKIKTIGDAYSGEPGMAGYPGRRRDGTRSDRRGPPAAGPAVLDNHRPDAGGSFPTSATTSREETNLLG
jgi:class 3 adenylate cyclase